MLSLGSGLGSKGFRSCKEPVNKSASVVNKVIVTCRDIV